MGAASLFERCFDFTGKTVLVTGGAAGIGHAVATLFTERGAHVALLDRIASVADVARALPGGPHHGLLADVTDRASLDRALPVAAATTGRIDVLVNCAGIVRLSPAEDLTQADWDATIAVNLTGSFVAAQAVGRVMLEAGAGRIINLASQAAVVGLTDHVAYCASKAAILGMTRVLALEWGPRGITVNAISPTVVETDLGRRAWAGEVGDRMRARIPTRRFATPQEIAMATLYLASGAAGMVNGENLVIDGGFSIQ